MELWVVEVTLTGYHSFNVVFLWTHGEGLHNLFKRQKEEQHEIESSTFKHEEKLSQNKIDDSIDLKCKK